MKRHKGKIIAAAIVCLVLVATFIVGGNYPEGDRSLGNERSPAEPSPGVTALAENPETTVAKTGQTVRQAPAAAFPNQDEAVQQTGEKEDSRLKDRAESSEPLDHPKEESSEGVYAGSAEYSAERGMLIDPATGKDRYLTDPVPEGKPVPEEPQDAVISDRAYTCILSVRCDTIVQNIRFLNKEKVELVPEDGIIFPPAEVTFYEVESVFNVLHREMKKNGIHMAFRNTPLYNSAYIEAINNLYEFDCGELSGWMYKVNGWFPNYGASRYRLRDGDVIEWVYTCDLGRDVGGHYATGGGNE